MPVVPSAVRETLEALKPKYKFHIALSIIKGRFYIYRRTTRWDKEKKRVRSIAEYLGRIDATGDFVPKMRAQALGQPPQMLSPTPQEQPELDPQDARLLTALSMNARASTALLSRITGYSSATVLRRKKQLEARFGIRYTAEIDVGKLGYVRFLILVRFHGGMPGIEDVKTAITNEPRVQLAASMAGGDYDLIIYALAKDNFDAESLMDSMLIKSSLGKYDAEWYTSFFFETYGFVPLRDEFIETLRVKAARRSAVALLGRERKMLAREFALLKELNKDGAIDFAEIDKRYGFDQGRARYSYYKLEEEGLLKRITMTMTNLPIKYVGVVKMDIINTGRYWSKGKRKVLNDVLEESGTQINKYVYVGDMSAPHGVLFVVPVFRDGDLEEAASSFSKINGVRIKKGIVSQLITGQFCYRKFDNEYSVQRIVLHKDYGEKPPRLADYGGMKSRIKMEHAASQVIVLEEET